MEGVGLPRTGEVKGGGLATAIIYFVAIPRDGGRGQVDHDGLAIADRVDPITGNHLNGLRPWRGKGIGGDQAALSRRGRRKPFIGDGSRGLVRIDNSHDGVRDIGLGRAGHVQEDQPRQRLARQ